MLPYHPLDTMLNTTLPFCSRLVLFPRARGLPSAQIQAIFFVLHVAFAVMPSRLFSPFRLYEC